MAHQVLARKWRPRVFREMVGQEHVLRALINALDHERLHHAYLFTGTRGVGKTTVARILAKCLNCESGVSSEPCGECASCTEIAEGRSVDLLEVDAASRTKVDQTRELLDNVQYAPAHARYKVYLVDEVHMLSDASFNALLKTLEEPPPHVKFLLATTDPKKLPATVLSRCLQFNLKNMSAELIVGHLGHILKEEDIPFDEPALWLLGRAADGSMRDALSLTDQAVAYGSGSLKEADVRAMLGTVDRTMVHRLAESVAAQDAPAALEVVAAMSEQAPDYAGALQELASLLHRIALAQAVPDAVDDSGGDGSVIKALAARMTAEDAHLYYQFALGGRRDLALAPDPRAGFEMALLRMIAFRPALAAQEGADAEVLDQNGSGGQSPPADASGSVASGNGASGNGASGNGASGNGASGNNPSGNGVSGSAESSAGKEKEARPTDARPTNGATAPAPSMEPEPVPVATVEPDPVPVPAIEPEPSPASALEPEPAPTPTTDLEPAPDPEPAPAATTEPEPLARNGSGGPSSPEAASGANALGNGASSHGAPGNGAPGNGAEPPPVEPALESHAESPAELFTPAHWGELLGRLDLEGRTRTVASHCELREVAGDTALLVLDEANAALHRDSDAGEIAAALGRELGRELSVHIELGRPEMETPAARAARLEADRREQARVCIESDPKVQWLLDHFEGSLDRESITPGGQ